MSIGNVQSNFFSPSWASATSSNSGDAWNKVAASVSESGTNGTATAAANPFQTLATDIQAMLIQAQATAASTTSATTGASTALTPEQNLANALQTLMSDLQGGGTANTQTANTNSSGASGQTEHHHHHHHHEGGGDASGSTAVAGSTTSSSTSQASEDHAVSQVFAADIVQAIQAYGGASSASAVTSLTT